MPKRSYKECHQATMRNVLRSNYKLKRHLTTKHPAQVDKDLAYFERRESALKQQRLEMPSNTALLAVKQATLVFLAHRSAVVGLFDDMESLCISDGSNLITILN